MQRGAAQGVMIFPLFPVPLGHLAESASDDRSPSTQVGRHISRITNEAALAPDQLTWREVDVGMASCRVLVFGISI